jgi:hypothetical protein
LLWLGPEGCAAVLVGLALVVVALAAAWFVVAVVLPAVFSLVYWLLLRALTRVARDNRGCAGRLAPSVAWGALWSAVYIAPLALDMWGVHALLWLKGG